MVLPYTILSSGTPTAPPSLSVKTATYRARKLLNDTVFKRHNAVVVHFSYFVGSSGDFTLLRGTSVFCSDTCHNVIPNRIKVLKSLFVLAFVFANDGSKPVLGHITSVGLVKLSFHYILADDQICSCHSKHAMIDHVHCESSMLN